MFLVIIIANQWKFYFVDQYNDEIHENWFSTNINKIIVLCFGWQYNTKCLTM